MSRFWSREKRGVSFAPERDRKPGQGPITGASAGRTEGSPRARHTPLQRVRVVADGRSYEVLRRWDRGFALDAQDAPGLRGHVEIYEGDRHVCSALVVASSEADGERQFEFKYATQATATQPIPDFVRPTEQSAGVHRPG